MMGPVPSQGPSGTTQEHPEDVRFSDSNVLGSQRTF